MERQKILRPRQMEQLSGLISLAVKYLGPSIEKTKLRLVTQGQNLQEHAYIVYSSTASGLYQLHSVNPPQ